MKWIKYKVLQSVVEGENVFIDKKIGHNEANLVIAQAEAYQGKYEIVEDSQSFEKEPLGIEFGGTGAKTLSEFIEVLGINSRKAIAAPTTNLNELITSGIWYEYNKVCTGVPEELEGATILALIKNETFSNIIIQTLTRVSNGIIYVWERRYSSTGSWGSWQKDINSKDMENLRTMYASPSKIPVGTDVASLLDMINAMDTYSTVTFWIGAYPNIRNEIIAGLSKYGITSTYGNVTIDKTSATTHVTYKGYSSINIYVAVYSTTNNVGWTEWEKLPTQEDMNKKVGIAYQYSTITPTNSINDVLDIDTTDPYAEKNQPKKVYQMTTDTTAIANMPSLYPQGTGFVGMRYVHYFSSTNILVELMEFPGGRRWYNNYVTNKWNGWKCEPKNSSGDSISAVRNDLEDVGDTITATCVEVGYNDNIKVYATICMKKLSSKRCDLHINYKIIDNAETDTAIVYFMSAEKIKNALGLSSLLGGGNTSQVIFIPSFDTDSSGNLTIISAETALGVMGLTGIHANLSAKGLTVGRVYQKTDGTYAHGAWPIVNHKNTLYKPNLYGQINLYGVTYSI